MSTITSAPTTTDNSDSLYQGLEQLVAENVAAINLSHQDLFKVDIKAATGKSLFSHYLATFPEEDRPHYNCRVCAEWLKRYGQLVTIKDGVVTSVAFGNIPEGTDPEVAAVANELAVLIGTKRVVSVYTPSSANAEVQNDGTWGHFKGTFHSDLPFYLSLEQAKSVTGTVNEEVRNTFSWIFSYLNSSAVTTVSDLLTSGELSYAIKQRSEFTFITSLVSALKATENSQVKNSLVWEYVLKNRALFAHFQSSVLGELLYQIHVGNLELGIKRFKEFTASINYKRPTELPSERELEEARKFVTENGLTPALKRRYASLEDGKRWLWKTPVTEQSKVDQDDPFASVAVKDSKKETTTAINGGNVSFLRFVDEILPKATSLSMVFPQYNSGREDFIQFVTASDTEAKPIIKWDKSENRNPVSSFCYHNGSNASDWFEHTSTDRAVKGFSFLPDEFNSDKTVMRYGLPETGIVIIIEGCQEKNNPGLALFPEILLPELRPARRVIEEFSNKGKLDPRLEGTEPLAGIHFNSNTMNNRQFTFNVTLDSGTIATYRVTSYY